MSAFITFTVFGLVSGGAYAIAASGLVLTYTTSRVFNIGHGAVGMFMAFVYWQLHVHEGIPNLLAVPLVVLVLAPLFGAAIQRLMMRRMSDAPVSVSLVVTVALLVGLIGAAQQLWKPAARSVTGFPPGGFHIGQAFVTWNQALTIGMAGVVAVALYLLLNRTRTGIAMRAVVDNRDLLALHGARPQLLSSLSWAIGSSLAALAGVLLVPQVGVDYFALTLLVINAYAAAMLGRLQSLPLTYLGALALGLLQTYAQGYLPLPGVLQVGLIPAIPTLFLFAIIVLLPQAQLRVGQIKGIKSVPIPSRTRAGVSGLALLAVVAVGSGLLSQAQTFDLSLGLCDALLMLSLVLLTGYGGFVSLAQFTFAGIAAVAVAKLLPGSPLAIVVGVAVAAAVGALVAIPVLRLRGLYLALATLAFAQLMDKLVFQANFAFGFNGALTVKRLDLFGLHLASQRAYVLLVTVAFVVVGCGILEVRRGRYGRLLIAMRDSPAACGTLGVNLTWTRVGLFTASAAVAGLAGALLAGVQQNIGNTDFQMFNSLPLLLLAVVGGVTSVTGSLVGGLSLMLLPLLQSDFPSVAGLLFVGIAVFAVLLASNPNGVASYVFLLGRRIRGGLGGPPPVAAPAPGGPGFEDFVLARLPEEVRVGGAARG